MQNEFIYVFVGRIGKWLWRSC